ncbi:MAG: prolyl oligopeptidase family serine peptidase [Verrucomicrobia bacterium]|nr:prolyl oligopeptidase family serine peptidase [Verrucomicrobiota bacterium]MDA1005443.1 prolyl oligopeptidase family serine peptidase [Verrucomicrobiota bacterium]
MATAKAKGRSGNRKRVVGGCLWIVALCTLIAAPAGHAEAERTEWNGYPMLKFNVGGRSALLVGPKSPAPGKPWIWRTEFFGIDPQADIALLGKGLYVAYIDVGGLFGAPSALDAMDEYYAHVRKEYGLAEKVVLEGFSRGGLYAFNWAARHPKNVACIYADAPVCDFKSWPGGQGRARHSGRDWRQLLGAYGMNDEQALAYKLNPVDNLAPLAEAKIPILCVIGDMHDWIVPIEENALLVETRYKELGGEIQIIKKPEAGHRPHSLADPAPIVDFVMKHVSGGNESAPKRGVRAQAGRSAIPWNAAALAKAPKTHPTSVRPAKGMRSFFYEGADYKGRPTQVFAYYAAPGGDPPAGGWPAVVCAHGGGGTAYPGWVRYWNSRGYAAIAMDLEGHLPGSHFFGVEGNFPADVGHENAGPKRIDWFGDRDLPDDEQWFYHGVADVIAANSLLRSFPEINAKKIGLTGISWGGVIVSTVAGIDPRFAFVIPVYGGGFIHESDNPGLAQWFPPKNMTDGQFRDYRTKWDPSAHLGKAKMPMLWVTSVADPVFQIDIFAKSAQAAGGPSTLCLRPWMIHGHGNGWNDAVEIGQFADSIVKDGPPLPKLERPEIKSGKVHTNWTGKDITEAWIYFTTSGGKWKDRKWDFIQCTIGEKELVARKPLPQGTTAYFVYVFRDVGGRRSNHSASELVEVKR